MSDGQASCHSIIHAEHVVRQNVVICVYQLIFGEIDETRQYQTAIYSNSILANAGSSLYMPTLYSCSYYSRVRIGIGDGMLASLITITSGANEANVPAYGLFLIKKNIFSYLQK